jgi:hypothetical protein
MLVSLVETVELADHLVKILRASKRIITEVIFLDQIVLLNKVIG